MARPRPLSQQCSEKLVTRVRIAILSHTETLHDFHLDHNTLGVVAQFGWEASSDGRCVLIAFLLCFLVTLAPICSRIGKAILLNQSKRPV